MALSYSWKTSSPVPSPTVSGTNTKCAQYYQIGKGETCDTVTEKTGISKSDLSVSISSLEDVEALS